MQKQELINFIEAFYENRLPYAVIFNKYDVCFVGSTEEALSKNKAYMCLLTYGGTGSAPEEWCVSIHEYMDGRTVPLGNIEFFGKEIDAKQFAQEKINEISERSYIPENTLRRWVEMGLTVPDSIIQKMNAQFIEREEKLEKELQAMRAEREEFFRRYCN